LRVTLGFEPVGEDLSVMSESPGFSLFFGSWRIPLDITLLAVNDKGQTVGATRPDFTFHFRYRSTTFWVRFRDEGAKAEMDLSAWLGSMPFTAESGEKRQALRAIVKGVNKDLGQTLSVIKSKIALHRTLELPMPVTAVGLLERLCGFLLPLKPYLDLMDMIRQMPRVGKH
jgi:hypothetical protein